MGAHGRSPLRRAELGDRGRAARRACRPAAARRRCGRASRTSTSCSTACAAVPARRSRCARCGSPRSAPPPRRRRSTWPTRYARERQPTRRMWLGGVAEEVPVRSRDSFGAEPEPGPLLVDEYDTTVVVPAAGACDGISRPGHSCSSRTWPVTELREATPASDPVTLQIVANALQSIADEMATTIIRTAHSTVVRDGMDFSSALCDADGETVAQAVSVPFHLGSIPTAMASLIGHYGDRVRPGDVFIMNDPFDGGMHLQDIFVVKPVYLGDSRHRLGGDDRAPRRRRRPPARGRARATTPRSSRRGCGCPGFASTPRASRSRRCTS